MATRTLLPESNPVAYGVCTSRRWKQTVMLVIVFTMPVDEGAANRSLQCPHLHQPGPNGLVFSVGIAREMLKHQVHLVNACSTRAHI